MSVQKPLAPTRRCASGALVLVVVVAALFLLATGHRVRADVLDVPGQFSTIQAAIDSSVNGDVVVLQPGVYAGGGNTDLDFAGRSITVRSIAPSSPAVVAGTVIDCQGVNHAFIFDSGETPDARVEGLTIRNGPANVFGVIRSTHASRPTVADCVIRDCAGMAIRCTIQGGIILERCTIENNDSTALGVAVVDVNYAFSVLEARDCVFRDNRGRVISFVGTALTLENSIFERNAPGGAVWAQTAFSLEIRRCRFVENSSDSSGGALHIRPVPEPDAFEIANCAFIDNSAADRGGGLYMNATNTSGNAAVDHCTFLRNAAGLAGGNIGIGGRELAIRNTILWAGSAPSGSELYLGSGRTDAPIPIPPATVLIEHAIIPAGPTQAFLDTGAELVEGNGVVHVDPLFVDEAAGDIHIRPDSPAREAGDPAFVPALGETDIDGDPRLVGDAVDVGADELDFVPAFGDCDDDGDVDGADYLVFGGCASGPGGGIGAGCDCVDVDGDGDADLFDFADFQRRFGN